MSETMTEIEVLSQVHDETSLACDAAREKYIFLDRAARLIEQLAGGVLEISRRFTEDQFETYMRVSKAATAALEEYVVANAIRHTAFVAWYQAQYGIDLDAPKPGGQPE